MIQGFGGGNLRGSDLGVTRGNNIKTHLQRVGWGVTDWTDLFRNTDMWRALEKAVMNFRGP